MATGIADSFGPAYIGGMVTMILYGITSLQTYMYFMNYRDDGVATKSFVVALWILDTLHVSLMCHALYYYLIINYGDAAALADGVWSLFASVAVNLCIACSVQGFFTVKIFYLCRNNVRWLVTTPIIVSVVAHLGFGIETVVLIFIKKQFSSLSQLTFYAVTPFGAALVISDTLITIALCVLLRERGSRTVFPRTKRLVDTLVIYAINRCLLTSLVAIVEVVMWAVDTQSSWFMAIDFTIGKLYANSLLASLNSRNFLRGQQSGSEETGALGNTIHLSYLPRSSPSATGDLDPSRVGSDKFSPPLHHVLDIVSEPEDVRDRKAVP